MFDSPFNDRVPGKLVLAGFPWHGLMTLNTQLDQGEFSIALPNGAAKLLPNMYMPLVSALDFALPGDTLLFQDPRATATPRTPVEQAADQVAGREWRQSVIFGPYAKALYGKRPDIKWIFHDAEKNWAVQMSSGVHSVRLMDLVVSRDRGSTQSRSITLNLVGSYTQGSFGANTGYVLLDSSPTGDRALLGLYLRRKENQTDDDAWTYPCRLPLVELWEVRLRREGAQIVGDYECIRTPTQVVGQIDAPPYPPEQLLTVSYGVEWEQTGSDPITWTGNGVINGGSTAVGQWQNGYTRAPWLYREHGRIISAYYGEDNAVREVTLELRVQDTFSSAMSPSTTSSAAETTPNPFGHPGGHRLVSPGSYSLSVDYNHSATSVTTMTLRDAGSHVGEVTITSTGSQSTSYSATLAIVQNTPALDGKEERSTEQSSMLSNSHTVTIDGVTVYSESASSPIFGGDAKGGSYQRQVWKPWITWKPDGAVIDDDLSFEIFPVRYSSQMHALAVRERVVGDPDKTRIGITGHKGGTTPGVVTRTGAMVHLFGSHNPLTGEAVRDQLKPVCWI